MAMVIELGYQLMWRTPVACRVHTRVNAVCCAKSDWRWTKGILRGVQQTGFYWVVFDVVGDAVEFVDIAHPVVLGFSLPEGFSGAAEETVRFSGSVTFEGFQQAAWCD
jgi:hypothetical protein